MRMILALIRKEYFQIKRDPAMLFLIFAYPIVQLLILGTAISVEVKNLPIAICNLDNTELSRSYISSFQSNDYLYLSSLENSTEDLRKALDEGTIKLGLTIPNGFMRDIVTGKKVNLLAQIDGVDGNGANIASGYLMDITANFLRKNEIVKTAMMRQYKNTGQANVEINPELLFNPNGEPTMHFIPGIMALLITVISTTLTAFSLVKEKELGTFEQLMVTPINKIQFIAGKITPFFILSLLEMVIAIVTIRLVYSIELKSSPILLFLGIILYLLNSLSIGIFVSTITKTQQQALFLAWFIMIFVIMMSGFLFPVENMPGILEKLSKFNPLYYFINILRGVFVKGSGFKDLLHDFRALLLLGSAAITAGYFSFSKKNI